ncbi:Vacuolar protein-sorting-associated protein 25 [Balamuthia mandrillaris]
MQQQTRNASSSSSSSSSSSFSFPWFHESPPFYTLQPVLNTRKKQLELWANLVLDYCQHFRIYELGVADAAQHPLFCNTRINRRLNGEALVHVFEHLVQLGNAEWADKERTKLAIFWRTPMQWADQIYKWVNENGLTGTVMTVYELREGPAAKDQEFSGLDQGVLVKALQILEKQGKAKLFSGSEAGSLGVKF